MLTLRRWHARNTFSIAAMTLLVAALASTVNARAASPLPAPTQIHASVSSDIAPPCQPSQTCGNPGPLVVQNTLFNLHIHLTDDTGAEAAFNKDTKLVLSASAPGTLSATTLTVAGGSSTADLMVSYSTFANGVTITVSSSGKGAKTSSVSPGTTDPFDVLQTLESFAQPGAGFQHGIGPDDCATVSSTDPVCGILVLPNGANTGVLLSTGSCTNIGCNTKGTVTQFIGDISGLYSKTNPATLIIKCYRSVCGRGGVSQLLGLAADSQQAGALNTAPPCPAKNTIGNDQSYCTDQVQNVRINADDSLVYILFADDFRGSL